jgi:uncharacterized repeat protein (TIGR01451 family)
LTISFVALLVCSGIVAVSFARRSAAQADSTPESSDSLKHHQPEFVPGEILVRFRQSAPAAKNGAQLELATVGGDTDIPLQVKRLPGPELVQGLRLATVAPADTARAIEELRKRSDVIYAEPNYIRRKSSTPNDPRFTDMWNLKNLSQPNGSPGAGMNAEQAWNTTTGSRDVVVAVIDEGIDVNHPDLHDNIWRNPGEIAGNHVDDDGNGFVDDLNGYDFFHSDSSVYDGPGTNPDDSIIDLHGTHVAGTIGAQGNNGLGVVGVNWQVGLMSLKFLGPDGGSSADVVRSYGYAKMMRDRWVSSNGTQGANIRVTNNSYGGGGYSQAEADAIQAMGSSGILFVVAAGNEAQDNRIFPSYPASYDLPNVISVASIDQSFTISSFSNRSSRTVHIGAPGRGILSTTPGNTYNYANGTSMASPHVAGAAALVLAAHPDMNVARLRAAILFGSVSSTTFAGVIVGGRLLNAAGALQNAEEVDTVSPAPLSDLRLGAQDGRSVTLNWTASGEDGAAGQASLYELRFVDASTNSQFLLAIMRPGTPGTPQSASVNIPFRHANGAFLIRTIDNAGNETDTNINVSVSDPAIASPYTVTTDGVEPLSVGGSPLGLAVDDQINGYPLPFSFPFYERFYSSVFVSTNGALYFANPPNHDGGSSVAGALNGRAMVAGMWDDLDLRKCFRSESDVYSVTPDNDRVIFRWQGVKFDSPTCPTTPTDADQINFEIELRRDGTIRTRYGQNTPIAPIVGIGAGEPEAYIVDSHTSDTATKDLSNAPALTFSLRRLPNVADLSVSNTASANLVSVGQDVTFNITAQNRGPSRTLGVRVVDTLPLGASFVSCTTSQGACSAPANGKVQIDMGLIESGGSATAAVVVQPTSSQFGAFINQATITGPLTDSDSNNNSSSSFVQLIIPNQNPQTGIVGIGAAGNQSFAIRSDRFGLAWGANQFGQLGDGSVSDKPIGVRIKNVSSIAAIEGGFLHTLALKQDGTVWSSGRNDKGQLGDGTTADRKMPEKIAGLISATRISGGRNHSLALRADGTVWAWGDNTNGQLGDGATVNRAVPAQVPGLNEVISIAAGSNHSLAVKSDGTVWAWGGNESGQLGDSTTVTRTTPVQVTGLTNITTVVASDGYSFYGPNGLTNVTFSVALRSDGTVWTWGHNWRGQLGDGTTNNSSTPHQVAGLTGISDVSAGGFHVIARRNDGTVWAWGGNFSGQLGDTTTIDRYAPVPVVGLTNIQSIAAGVEHSLALRQDGHVFGWGSYSNGQLGMGATVGSRPFPYETSAQIQDPLPIGTVSMPAFNPDGCTFSAPKNVVVTSASENVRIDSFYVGGSHNLVRLSTGAFYGWGDNLRAQLGSDPGLPPEPGKTRVTTAVTMIGLDNLSALSLGGTHNLLLKTDGSVWTSGSNAVGELGYPTYSESRATFAQVPGLSGVTAVAAGSSRSLALKTEGSVWSWGIDSISPVQVNGIANVIAIACGSASFAIRSDGSLWAWGVNHQGILGDGTETYHPTPVQVLGLSNVTAVSSGLSHSVALKSDGTVWVWGSNTYGQLGLGDDFSQHLSPVQVPGLTGVTAIAAGGYHTLVLKSDGNVWAWGQNSRGELGDGTNAQRRSPVRVGLTSVSAIKAGWGHSVAQKEDGTLFTWGMNYSGQLGDGTTDDQTGPIQMRQLTGGVQIHYTTNGADPTEDDPLYGSAAPVFINQSTVLKARAYKDGWAPSAVKTATYTVTASPPSDWQPAVLTAAQVEQLKAWTVGGRTYVYVMPKFPDAGYRVTDWGQAVRAGNDFSADALVEKFNGAAIQAVKTTAQIYDLGSLVPGSYNFIFKNSGTVVKSLAFTVSASQPPPNPIDDQRQFVRQQYLDFLNREPDGPGWDFWTGEITQCTTDPSKRSPGESEAQCIIRKRANTSAAFFLSPEFQNTGYFVLRVYRGSLGRMPYFGASLPADNTKDEFTRDHATVSAGIVVNNQLDQAVMYANKQAFVNQFVTRADFLSIYGGLNDEQYVDKLFETTNVVPTSNERQALINGLAGGNETRASVLFKIVDGRIEDGVLVLQTRYGKLFYDQQLNPGFVQMEYFGYMRRDPDDAGYAFWLAKLNQYGGNFVDAQMVLAFISSPEYRARFGQP